MFNIREKFATQVNTEILAALRSLAGLIEKRNSGTPRAYVMDAYLASHYKYASLYKKLA